MRPDDINGKAEDPETLALLALGWLLSDSDRSGRLLALTGLDAEGLRRGVGDPVVLGAVLTFIEGHEADLLACAGALECDPRALVAASRALAA